MLLCYSYANGLANVVDSPSLMRVGGRQGGTELFTRHRYFFQLATMYYMLVHPRLSNNNNIQPQTVISLKQQERECDHREEKTRSNSRLDTEQPPTSQVTCKREGIVRIYNYDYRICLTVAPYRIPPQVDQLPVHGQEEVCP